MANKIDSYGLRDVVLSLHNAGKSQRQITKFINSKIPKDDEPISEMAVYRYLKAERQIAEATQPALIEQGKQEVVLTDEQAMKSATGVDLADEVNTYEETLKLIGDCDFQIESLKLKLESCKDSKFLTKMDLDNMDRLDKFIARKQSLLSEVTKLQAEMAKYEQIKEAMKILYEAIQEISPESYELFKRRVAEKQNKKSLFK